MPAFKFSKQLEDDKVRFVQLQFSDLFGVVKGVTIPVQHLDSALESGKWFDGSSIEGFARIAESDMFLKPDVNTYAVMPWLASPEGNTARFICDVYNHDGSPFEGDPRFILKRVMAEAERLGFEYKTSPELEFFLFRRDNGALRALPYDHRGYFDMMTAAGAYSVEREAINTLKDLGIDVEVSHHEVGWSQYEVGCMYDNALRAADNAATVRFALKFIAQRHGLHATFMPKPIAGVSGSGMHVHQSLFDIKANRNLFYDADDRYGLSPLAYKFIAGQLSHIRGMSAVLSPTVNSYKRLVPGYEAPVYASWGSTNRSALIRVPRYFGGKSQAARVELRSPDPSCNIYLAFAVMLKAGLEGIVNNLSPPIPVEGDVYHFSDEKLKELGIGTLPGSLGDALEELKKDDVVKEALGNHMYERYIEAKRKEWDEFRLYVSQWELDRYLEVY